MKSTKYRQPNYFVRRTIFFLSVRPTNHLSRATPRKASLYIYNNVCSDFNNTIYIDITAPPGGMK